jgi:hypothetical protein
MHGASVHIRLFGLIGVFILGSTSFPSGQSGVPLALSERPGGGSVAAAVPDGEGGAWIAGSGDGNTIVASPDAAQRQAGGFGDGFLAHVAADGSILYVTFLGGSGSDEARGVARDAAGNLYVAGATNSGDFPTTAGALQTVAPSSSYSGFVVKLDPTGKHVLYSTYLGGIDFDQAQAIAVDAGGVAHVVGTASGSGFPITTGRCLALSQNAFYTRLSADGTSMLFGTCLDDSRGRGVALDAAGNAYVVGFAGSHFGPLMNAAKVTFPAGAGSQGFLAKFSGATMPFSTLLGGEASDEANAVAVTQKGIYVAGGGISTQYPGAPARTPVSSSDGTAWIMKVRLDGVAFLGTTVLDGNGSEQATSLQVDGGEVVHITGWTDSANFPATVDAAQPTLGGNSDAFYATAWMPQNVVGDPSYVSFLGGGRPDLANALAFDGTGGAWIGGTASSSDFPNVNAKTTSVSQAFLARFGQSRITPPAGTADIVLYAKDASAIAGNWQAIADSSAAGGTRLWNPDAGVPKITTPSANPPSYFELTFTASAGVPYHLWLRMKADNDFWGNDSVWLQFSDSVDVSGNPVWRTGSTSGTWVGLEDCSGCGVQGWGWNDNGYGVAGTPVTFATTGTHTVRIQQREDGISIDQVVISSGKWASTAPGANKNDTTILNPPPPPPPPASAKEIVLYAGTDATVNALWTAVSDPTAAAGVHLLNPDRAQPKLATPLSSNEWFEISFNAEANTPYHLWMRSRATNDHWMNDSVFVQFSGSVDANGASAFRIGTNDATVVSLEECTGCGEQGWGWNDNAYAAFAAPIYFATSGPQTIRVLRREDGIAIDQIVLSAAKYLNAAPGAAKNDTTIVPK